MAGRAVNKETIKKNTVRDMKKLNVYKPEYDPVIDVYCEMREQYERITEKYKKSGYQYAEETDRGGTKKATVVATLEVLRKDLLSYSDRLCLNPKALSEKKVNENNKKGKVSVLGKALAEIEKD